MKMKKRLRHMALIAIALIAGLGARAQEKTTQGKVSDASNHPLAGVTVMVKGGHAATTTDENGAFSIKANAGDVLVFSSVGFGDLEQKLGSGRSVSIILRVSSSNLNEVVVVGYGTQNRKDVTGSTVTIKTDNLPKVANTSINDVLQGQAAGLNVALNSAQPGGSLTVNIRGGLNPSNGLPGSTGSPAPLYVVDGVPLFNNSASEPAIISGGASNEVGFSGGINRDPLNGINPSDIESIDVLKDASAAAIYGSAAASGVILITTKKGKSDGRVNTDYRGSYTWQTPKKYLDFLDAHDFEEQQVRISHDKFLSDNGLPPYNNFTTTSTFTPLYSPAQIAAAGAGTDWIGLLSRDGSIQEHNLAVSGGNDKTRVYTSFNYYDNKALLKNSDFLRYSGRVNLEQKLSNRIKLSLDLNMSQVNSNNQSTGGNNGGSEKFNALQAAYAFSPTVGVFDNSGNYTKTLNTEITNPAAFLIINDKLRTKSFFAAPNLEIKIIDGLKFNAVGGISQNNSERKFYLPIKAQDFLFPQGLAQISTQSIQNYSAEGYATYTKNFGDHNLSLVGGGGWYKSISESTSMQGVGFFTDALGYNNIGLATDVAQNFVQSYRNPDIVKISQFFRANYSYKSKYILTFNARRDGASDFAPNKKYGFFPGVSAAWRISDEGFMANMKTVSDLKLRAGYGTVGQDANLNSLALYAAGVGNFLIGNTFFPGVAISQLDNPNLSWETIRSANIGVDYGFFKGRITGSIDVFKRDRLNIIVQAPLPENNAVNKLIVNLGSQSSKGIEFAVNTKNIQGAFTWETNFNISNYVNRWTKRNPYQQLAPYEHANDRTDVIYGWQTGGIIKSLSNLPADMPKGTLGNLMYKDQNKDGALDASDVVRLGYGQPAWSFGFSNRFSYRNFDLNVVMYGRLKQYMLNNLSGFYSPARIAGTSGQNVLTDIKKVWTVDNPTGSLPGIAPNYYDGGNPSGNSDFFMQSVNFLRIRNVTLGYTLNPTRIVHSVRFFLDIQNLAILTNYKGFDPELAGGNEGNPYPEALSTTAGVNINF
jgi:TonB-dependent starch-binding outer membrane protein SusC